MPIIKHNRQKILQFIIQYKRDHDGNSPTLRQIMDANGIGSSSAMRHIIINLEQEGTIIYGHDGESRSIQVVGGRWTYHG